MKLKVIAVGVIIAVVVTCAAAFAADSSKGPVGVVNLQKIMTESKSGKEAKAAFDKELESKRSMFSAKEKSARDIDSDLKSNGAKMKADVRKAKEDKLVEEVKDLKRMRQDVADELKKKDKELISKVIKDVLEIARKVGVERGYSLVIQASPQIVYLDKSIDITDEVLKRYDSGK